MNLPLSLDLPASIPRVHYGVAAVGVAAAIVVFVKFARPSNLDAIPSMGVSGWLGFWRAGLNSLTHAIEVIDQGYKKYHPAPFKVVDKYRWIVLISSREHIEELRKAPDDELSSFEAINDQLNARYTMADEVHDNPYHITLVRSHLTRNIGILYPEVREEIVMTFDEALGLKDDEWKSIVVLNTAQKVVCRASNRAFVGLPLCRHPDWVDLNIHYTIDVAKTGLALGLLPGFIKPLASRFLTTVPQDVMRAQKLLGPIVEERLKHLHKNDWEEKPNDFLLWMMELAEPPLLTIQSLTNRILHINFAGIHTTASNFTTALFYLVANPQFIQPLREEVEAIIEREGWSKDAVDKMHRVDSFLRECQRMEGIGALSMLRKALKDFRFSDGTLIPKGTLVGIASRGLHYDERFYENPDVFKPFRFADMQGGEGESSKNALVSTSTEYLPFGHGKHACTGRFFAVTEMKTMLAHVVTTYDIKLEDGAPRPSTLHFGATTYPDPNAAIMFRKRRVD